MLTIFGLSLLIFLLQASPSLSAEIDPVTLNQLRSVWQRANDTIDAMEDTEFVEGCCPAWAWKRNWLTNLAKVQARTGDRAAVQQTIQRAKQINKGEGSLDPLQMALVGYAQASIPDREGTIITLQEALNLAQQPEFKRIRDTALPTVVRAYARVGEVAQALSAAGLIRDAYWKSIALSAAATERVPEKESQTSALFIARALEVYTGITNSRDQAAALRAIGVAQIKTDAAVAGVNTLERALAASRLISDILYQVDALIYLGKDYVEVDMPDEARLVWEEVVKTAKQIQSEQDKADRLWRIALPQARHPEFGVVNTTLQDAYASATRIEDPFYKANIIREIGEVYAIAGQTNLAWERFKEAERIALALPQESLRAFTLLHLAKAQADVGNTVKAIQTAQSIDGAAIEKNYAYFYIALAQTKAGDFEGALRSFHAIANDSHLKAETTQEIAKALSAQGYHDSAYTWANSLSSPRERVGAFLGMTEGLVAH
jgi:tetratricopeptide (TPR) repeat protein